MSDPVRPTVVAGALLLEAALGDCDWDLALQAVADACGGRSGQLIALNADGEIAVHRLTNAPETFIEDIEAFGLANPVVNPRVRIGRHAATGALIADQDYVDAETRARHPIYAEMFEPNDFPFNCQTVLDRRDGRLVRASVTRSRKQGPFDAAAFRAMAELVPSLQTAVRLAAVLAGARMAATLQAFETLKAAALLLDGEGRIVGLSAAGQALIADGSLLTARNGRLKAACKIDQAVFDHRLATALSAAKQGLPSPAPPICLRAMDGRAAREFDVQSLPLERSALGQGPAVLVIALPTRAAADPLQMMQTRYGLTGAESAIAAGLVNGLSLAGIAADRGVSRATVRSQMQAIYAKTGTHRQGELVALLLAPDAAPDPGRTPRH